MNFLKILLNKKEKAAYVFNQLPEGVCPNCWGDQEYGDMIRYKAKDAQIDVNNKNANYAFIQDFIVTHLNGIKLKSSIHGQECSNCKLIIKKNDEA